MRKVGPLVQSDQKYCFRCSSIKLRTEFSPNRSKPDGRSSQCRPCAREGAKQSRLIKQRLDALAQFIAARSGHGMLELPAVIAGLALS